MYTIGNWIVFGLVLGCGVLAGLFAWFVTEDNGGAVITLIGTLIILFITMISVAWYNTSTAAGMRAVKDYKSNINNGLNREITITAEDGREIFHFEGKVDIESDHEDNYIKFDDSTTGKRYIIYYGIMDTVTIIEK